MGSVALCFRFPGIRRGKQESQLSVLSAGRSLVLTLYFLNKILCEHNEAKVYSNFLSTAACSLKEASAVNFFSDKKSHGVLEASKHIWSVPYIF